jgi:hypothetical protein
MINGTYSKEGFIWIAYLPLIHLSAHALTPYKCLESLSLSLEQLIKNSPFEFEIRISDNARIILLADEKKAFHAFFKVAIRHDFLFSTSL